MNKEFKVIGYYAGWKGWQPEKTDFSILTHVIYSFAIPTVEGHLRPMDHPDLIRTLVTEAHKAGRKASIAVGGWSYEDIPLEETFVKATDTPEKIHTLGEEILALCEEYDLDGIDIDWEHPRVKNGTYKQYEALILYLSEKLHEKGKYLTSAVLSGKTWDGQVWEDSASHTDAVLKAVDWLNVMTYDGGEGRKHSTYDFAVDCMGYWRNDRGLPKEKVMMGVPFYSYNPGCSYETLLEKDSMAWDKDVVQADGKEYHYNGIKTMTDKVKYALEHCGGVMIWEITEDTADARYSLLKTIKKSIDNQK